MDVSKLNTHPPAADLFCGKGRKFYFLSVWNGSGYDAVVPECGELGSLDALREAAVALELPANYDLGRAYIVCSEILPCSVLNEPKSEGSK